MPGVYTHRASEDLKSLSATSVALTPVDPQAYLCHFPISFAPVTSVPWLFLRRLRVDKLVKNFNVSYENFHKTLQLFLDLYLNNLIQT
jgi:hypothetical protein